MKEITVIGARFEHRIYWPFGASNWELCRAHWPAVSCPCGQYQLRWVS